MSEKTQIEVHANDMLGPVYETVGEGLPHVDAFTDQVGFDWRTWCQDKEKMVPLIRPALLDYWTRLKEPEQTQLQITLQYLLNVDEKVPYVAWPQMPELTSKMQGVGAKYFASYQDTIQPFDWYALCLWMWEILFPHADWHADISEWVLTDRPTLYQRL